jgi:hypothetical protein
MARWYPLADHPIQKALITDKVRFKVVPAGRRSGKTERAKRFVAKELMRNANCAYFLAAPTRNQAKNIYWEDMKLLTMSPLFGREAVSESELRIKMPNGSSVSLLGLDQPQRIEGSFWHGGVIDEIANVKQGAWEENISPALDTYNPKEPNYRAWCWLIGVPEGLNHYYDMAEYARTADDPDWKLYTWHSADILKPEAIEAAKRRMSERQYKQEYEASFEVATGKLYSDYGDANRTTEVIEPHEQLHWFHDFNYTPLSSGVGVRRGGNNLYILDEIILISAVARQAALEFVHRYAEHKNKNLLLFGDPAGKAGEKHGHVSDYIEIEKVLKVHGWKVTRQVKNAAPAIVDRQNAVRAKIQNAAGERSLFVNALRAPYCHKGLSTVQAKKNSTFLEEDSKYQHITTAIGYCVDFIWPVHGRKEYTINTPQGSAHFWGSHAA